MGGDPALNPYEGVQLDLGRFAVHRATIVAISGLWASGAFWLTLRIPTEPVLPLVWPFIYGTAAILTLAVLARPVSRRLHWWLTTVGLMALALRPSVAFARWALLGVATVADVGFSCTVYALAGVLWLRFSQGSLRAWRYNAIARKVT